MCDATMILGAVMKAGDISAANSKAEADQTAALDQQTAMNQQRAMEQEGIKKKASLELTAKKRERMRELASSKVAAAESGAAGASTLRNFANVFMQESMDAGTVISIQETNLAQVATQSQADFLRTRGRINQAQSTKSTGIGAALQIAGAGASANPDKFNSFFP